MAQKEKKKKGIFDGIRKPTAPPSKRHDSDKRKKDAKPKHKKPIESDE
jgi:hypothetical protein